MTTTEYDKLHCPNCDEWKAPDEFYRNKARHTGRQVYCIVCEKARRGSNPDMYFGRGTHTGPWYVAVDWLIEENRERWEELRHKAEMEYDWGSKEFWP